MGFETARGTAEGITSRAILSTLTISLLPLVSCGVNEVTIRIEGGDGNKVRLDAGEVRPGFNRVVDAGSVSFGDVEEGAYAIHVVTSQRLMSDSLKVEAAPVMGVRSYGLTVTIPGGHNGGYQPQGTILYAATPAAVLDWDLYTIPAAGGEPTRLTDTPEFEQYPAWSADGREIAFARGHVMTNIDIYVMAADGGGERRLTEHPERDEQPAWSPDGGTIAFLSHRDGDVAIWLMDPDGGNKRKLALGREPAWSPDGNHIAFTSGQYDGNDEIYLIDADGSNLRRLTTDSHYDWHAAWSPEGRRLAFNSERFGGEELMLADVESGRQVRVTVAKHTFEQDPVWSPDGRALAYQGKMNFREDGTLDVHFSNWTGKHTPQGAFDIFIVSPVGFDWDQVEERPVMPVNLTNTPDREERSPRWRPF